ncbi:hypothetical protein C7Y71_004690 [Pseudoprevotella muciniphila]|uniref:DUF5067 domain-containing protein n=1 Tax=Pseudoprevotella muciniphila TaxID=2133944 RepID=A0A5P8E5T3_9BACT|nr:hypothetical protein [Pseudoprevotella muciniphila]QFQ12365.1 hypothetical protein C7Y71_004690 [Pseudoprevotella muciniphila]
MKILKTFLAVACCAMMFTACGGSDKAEQKTGDSTATENTEGAEAQKAEEPATVNPVEDISLTKDGEDLGSYEYKFYPKSHNLTITIKKELAKDVTAYTNITAPYEADAQTVTVDYTAATVGGNLTGSACSSYSSDKAKAHNEKLLEEKKALGKVTYTVTQEAAESGGKLTFTLASDKETVKMAGYK